MNPELHHDQESGSLPAEPSQSEMKLVTKYLQRYRASKQEYMDKHRKWAIIDLFDRGDQWSNVSLPPWIPKPVHNLIKKNRLLKRANLAGNIPSAHYVAVNPDQKDKVDRLQKAYKHVWDTNRASYLVRRCIDRAYLYGAAIVFVYEDPVIDGEYYGEGNPKNRLYQGEIVLKRIKVTDFFPDPDATSLADCKWIDILIPTTIEEVKKNPKFIEYAGNKLKQLKLSADESDADTSPVNELEAAIQQPDDRNSRVKLHMHFEYRYTEDGDRKLDVSYYLEQAPTFILYRQEDVKPNVFPFAILYDEEEDDDLFGSSTAQDILEKQKLINKTEQTVSVIGTLNQSPQKVVARESGINGDDMAKASGQPGKVWITNIDPSRSVFELKPPDIPKGLFEMKDRSVNDVNDYVGINEAYTGESVGSLTTSTGVNSLIERATIRDRDKMKQIDRFVEDLSDLIVRFILEKWTKKRNIINMKQAGKVEHHVWEPIDKKDAENLKWFVQSDVYATAPLTQAMKKQQAEQLMQMQLQFQPDPPLITLEEWLDLQDYPNKDEIRKRMEKDRKKKEEREAKNLAQIVMQLADQARQMIAKGMPVEQVNNQLIEQAKQVLEGDAKKAAQIGMGETALVDAAGGGRPRDAAKAPQPQQGDVGKMAMTNMIRGQ